MPANRLIAGMARSYNLFTTNRLIRERRYGDSLSGACQTPSIKPCAGR